MKNKFLIPITYSDVSKDVIKIADGWAQQLGAEIHFMHVCPDRSLVNTYSGQYFDLTKQDQEQMEDFLNQHHIKANYKLAIRSGTTYLAIINEEEAIDPLLIIMPSHSHTFLSRLLMGSNTDYVVHHSRGPVYIYKKSEVKFHDVIIVPLDFTEVNKAVAHLADEWAQNTHCEIYFIHVGTLPSYYGNSIEYDIGFGQEEIKKMSEQLKEQLHTFVKDLRIKSKHYEVLEFGKPYHHIEKLQEQQKAKLIMMASHSHTMMDRLLAGSTTDYLLHHSACPLYVYKSTR